MDFLPVFVNSRRLVRLGFTLRCLGKTLLHEIPVFFSYKRCKIKIHQLIDGIPRQLPKGLVCHLEITLQVKGVYGTGIVIKQGFKLLPALLQFPFPSLGLRNILKNRLQCGLPIIGNPGNMGHDDLTFAVQGFQFILNGLHFLNFTGLP